MNLKTFSKREKEALLDLLLAGMYSDAHIAEEEDTRIKRLLKEFEFEGEYRQDLVLNQALTRVRQRAATREGINGYVTKLAQEFSKIHRQDACDALEELIGIDQQVTQSEENFLNMVKTAFAA